MLARLKDLSLNLDGSQDLRLTVFSDMSETFSELQNEKVELTIKKVTNRRSLDANALAWVIIDQIAERTGIKKSEVYRNAIREIGGVSDVVCVQNKAVNKLVSGWVSHGQGWQAEVVASKLPGCSNVTLYYGSSVYNTKQMSQLIDSLTQDALALGIVVRTQEEVQKSLDLWSRKLEKAKREDGDASGEIDSSAG